MELNQSIKTRRKVVKNPEGSLVLQRQPEIQLYLEASSFNIKKDDLYKSNNDKINSLISLSKQCPPSFVLGLSKFLSDNGIKTSPVVMLSTLSNEGGEFGNITDIDTREKFMQIFNTPQRVAEAIALQNLGYLRLNSSFKKCVLKHAVEQMSAYTLQKNRMDGRNIKIKDLIKYLRPNPRIPSVSALYKDIIEDGPLSKLPLEQRTLTQVKSDDSLNDKDKVEYYKNNIDKIPLNMLIRNLKFIAEQADFKTNLILQEKIYNRLDSIDGKSMRFLNVFDLIEVALNVPAYEKLMFGIIEGFVEDIKHKFNYEDTKGTVLFDFSGSMNGNGFERGFSGSMNGNGFERGFKYLVLFSLLFKELDLYTFANDLHKDNLNGQPIDIRKGNIANAKKVMVEYFRQRSGGTALLQSTRELLNLDSTIKNLIVISDEVSWKEGDNLIGMIGDVKLMLKDKTFILVNPVVADGSVFQQNVIGFSGISANILYNVMIGTNQHGCINFIRDY